MRNELRGSLLFWGRMSLEYIGMTCAVSLLMLFLIQIGGADFGSGSDMLAAEFAILPYYLLVSGMVLVMLAAASWYRNYMPLLISMNVTRRTATGGMFLGFTVTIAGILVLMAVIWQLAEGDIAASGKQLLPLFTGAFLIAAAFCMILGVIMMRWGKIGAAIYFLICMSGGAAVGAFVSSGSRNILQLQEVMLEELVGGNYWPVLAVGVILYVAAGIFSMAAMRKIEIRV